MKPDILVKAPVKFCFFKYVSDQFPSKRLLVLKTSWWQLQDKSWRCLQHVFSVTIFRPSRRLQVVLENRRLLRWRRLQDVLETCLEDVLKTSWRHILKTFWRLVLKTSSRRLGDKQIVYWGYLYLKNLNVYIFDLTNLYLTNLDLKNLKWIQNPLIRTQ